MRRTRQKEMAVMSIPFKQCHSTNYRVGRRQTIKYIVIHYTANNGDTAAGNASYFAKTPNLQASAHYFVDENGIYQSVREGDAAWHCGGTRYTHPYCRIDNALGIEICSRYNGDFNADKKANCVDFNKYYFKDEAVENAAALTKELMAKYNIPIKNVIRHYDVTGKICPAPFVNDAGKWEDFKAMLTAEDKKSNSVVSNEEEEEMRYYKLKDVPHGEFHDTIKALVDKGVIKGNAGTGEDTEVDLSHDMVRMFVINHRAGLYK